MSLSLVLAVWLSGCGLFGARDGTGCEDAACARDAAGTSAALALSEDCTDGTDNDGDGLVDCEDGDCADVCVESDCSDGLDDDLDGRTDCDDEDCWGLSCATVVSRVSGGGMRVDRRRVHRDGNYYSGTSSFWEQTSWDTAATLEGVWGTAQVLMPGDTTWTTCDWSFTSGQAVWAGIYSDFWSTARGAEVWADTTTASLSRAGFAVDAGCPVSTSGFLPREAALVSGGIWVDGAPRYFGLVNTYTRTFSRSGYLSPIGSRGFDSSVFNTSWTVSSLKEGGTWTYGE